MNGLLVIARNDPLDDALALEAKRRGVSLLRLSLLETLPGAGRARFLEWLRSPPSGAAVAWTSRRAAEALVALAAREQRAALERVTLFAAGAESAAPARDAGLTVDVPERGDGAAALAGWIARRRAARGVARVAMLHGDKTLPTLEDGLRKAGVPVDAFELYRTRFLAPDLRVLAEAIVNGGTIAVTYYSPSGVDALEGALPAPAVAALREQSHVLPRGETTQRALAERGYRRVSPPGPPLAWFDSIAPGALQSEKRNAR